MKTVKFANEVRLKNFQHLEVEVIPELNTAWLYFNAKPRSCFTLTLLQELQEFQNILSQQQGKLPCDNDLIDIQYNVISSKHSVFSFGGDLDYFIQCIEKQDREGLKLYARKSIDAVYFNHIGREHDLTTISLVHGNALGGGFEAALSSHVIIAENQAEMGLPEVLFNLFPGMGAYQFISQKGGAALAEKMILSGRLYSAEELQEMKIVDVLAEDGEGRSTVHGWIRNNRKRQNTMNALRKVKQRVNPVDYKELQEIGEIWVDAAFNISEKDLRTMGRLVRSQSKHSRLEDQSQVKEQRLFR